MCWEHNDTLILMHPAALHLPGFVGGDGPDHPGESGVGGGSGVVTSCWVPDKMLRADGTVDWSPWYLTDEDDVGQSGEHSELIQVLHSSLRVLAKERDWSTVFVGFDNFFAWVAGEPHVQVSPDIYLIDNVVPEHTPMPTRWESWRTEHPPPRFAVEFVSADWRKDYEINPDRYDSLGASELVLADRDAVISDLSNKGRYPFVVWRRGESPAGRRLCKVYQGSGPVYCIELDAWLYFDTTVPSRPRARICRDAAGRDLVPTETELLDVKDQELQSKDQELQSKDQELYARLASASRYPAISLPLAPVEKTALTILPAIVARSTYFVVPVKTGVRRLISRPPMPM